MRLPIQEREEHARWNAAGSAWSSIGCRCGRHRYVNVYHITRNWGGPEEGGWWWNCLTPVESVRCSAWREAKATLRRLFRKHAPDAWGNIYHSTGGVEIKVCIESRPGAGTPTPHYE